MKDPHTMRGLLFTSPDLDKVRRFLNTLIRQETRAMTYETLPPGQPGPMHTQRDWPSDLADEAVVDVLPHVGALVNSTLPGGHSVRGIAVAFGVDEKGRPALEVVTETDAMHIRAVISQVAEGKWSAIVHDGTARRIG